MAKAKKSKITIEDALVPVDEQEYDIPNNWVWIYQNIACQLSDGEKKSGAEYPYLEVKYLRGNIDAEIKDSGKFITSNTKVILVDGENSGEVFEVLEDGYMGSTFKVLNISAGINEKYLLYFVDSKRELLRNNKTGSAIPHLNKKLFFSLGFPLPPLAEQERIVEQIENLFSKLDEAKEKAQEILDTFDDRKAAILYKAFQGNLTKQWRKERSDISAIEYLRKIEKSGEDFSKKEFKFWESNELPKTWAESKIGNLLYFAGRIGWKGLKADEYTEEGPLLLSVYNLNDGDEVSYNSVYHITTERYEESPEIMVEIGDVLLTKDGAGIGKLGYVKELPQEATINSSLLLIRPGNTAISKYIFYLLSGPELQSIVKERITGSATPHLFQRDIKEFTIPIPPLEEQEEIVRILDDVLEKEKIAYESAENVISQIELMKKSILAKAFRGELGTNNPEEESSSELLKSIIEGEE